MSAVDALVAGKDAAGAARRDQRELEAEEAPTLQRLKKAIHQGALREANRRWFGAGQYQRVVSSSSSSSV